MNMPLLSVVIETKNGKVENVAVIDEHGIDYEIVVTVKQLPPIDTKIVDLRCGDTILCRDKVLRIVAAKPKCTALNNKAYLLIKFKETAYTERGYRYHTVKNYPKNPY